MNSKVAVRHGFAVAVLIALLAATPLNASQIAGIVLDQNSMTPIAGALVSLQATPQRTTTDANGAFELLISSGTDLVIVGAAKGYYNKSILATPPATGLQILLEPVSQIDNPGYVLRAPENCASCHPNQYNEWTGSPMSQAGTNTWVHDIYNGTGTPGGMGGFVYTRDSAFADSNPASECASCHQPETWIPNPFVAMQSPGDVGYPSTAVMHGVSCEVCHKVADVDVTKVNFPGIFPGAVTYRRPPTGRQVMYGKLGDVDFTATGLMEASYQPQLAAEVCAACHQDKNDPDENHTYTGVTSEPTYIEWLESPYSDPQSPYYADCVTCHMPPSGEDTACDFLFPPLIRDPQTIRSHRIEGTTPYFLENAAELSLQSQVVGDTLEVQADVFNAQTGHHVPTGVTVRNMILLVEAWLDGDDPAINPIPHTGEQTVHTLGGVGDPAQGYYAGLPGKFYAKHNHNAEGVGPTFFTDATGIIFDNRIAALDTDTTNYTFQIPPGSGTVHVRARLIYRRAFRFLVDAKQWTEDGHGQPLADVMPPHYGHLMEMAEQSNAFDVPCPPTGDGDVNADGAVNGNDIAPFIQVLINAPTGPVSPAFCAADLDGDENVSLSDATLLIAALIAP